MDYSLHVSRVTLQKPHQLRPRLVRNQNNRDGRGFPLLGDKPLREAVGVVEIDEDDGESGGHAGHHGHEELEAVLVGESVEAVVGEGGLVESEGQSLELAYGGLVERAPAVVKPV